MLSREKKNASAPLNPLQPLYRPPSKSHAKKPAVPTLKLAAEPTLHDLKKQIARMKDPAEKKLVVHLKELYNYLKDHISEPNHPLFLKETITLLKRIDTLKTSFQYENSALVAANAHPEEFVKMVEQTLIAQSSALLDFEKNCEPASRISNYTAKIIACIIITSLFALVGFIAGAAIGFVAGGGVFSQFTTLAGMAQGTLTGVAIGAFLGTLLTGLPALYFSQNGLFKPTKLKQLQDAIVTETQNMFSDEERDRNNFLNL
jgi:hypothetical protein